MTTRPPDTDDDTPRLDLWDTLKATLGKPDIGLNADWVSSTISLRRVGAGPGFAGLFLCDDEDGSVSIVSRGPKVGGDEDEEEIETVAKIPEGTDPAQALRTIAYAIANEQAAAWIAQLVVVPVRK